MANRKYANVGKIFSSEELPVECDDDLEYLQLQFLSNNSTPTLVTELIEKYRLNPVVVTDTLLLIFDDVSICNFEFFPFVALYDSLEDHYDVVEALCVARAAVFINLLYQSSFRSSLRHLEMLCRMPCAKIYLQDPRLWGLSRPRVGVSYPDDPVVKTFVLKYKMDILQVNRIKKEQSSMHSGQGFMPFEHSSRNTSKNPAHTEDTGSIPAGTIEMDDNRKINNRNFILSRIVFIDRAEYCLPLFLDGALSTFVDLEGTKLGPDDAKRIEIIQKHLFEIIFPLLSIPCIKENFISCIKNVYAQDRTKIRFAEEKNCTDAFCYNLLHVLLHSIRGIFRPAFIPKIDSNRFPTFGFFYGARLMEISLARLMEVLETEERHNALVVIASMSTIVQEYLDFVYDVIEQRASEVYSPLAQPLATHLKNKAASHEGRLSRSASAEMDASDQDERRDSSRGGQPEENPSGEGGFMEDLRRLTERLDFAFEEKKAEKVCEILADASFISAILDCQEQIFRTIPDPKHSRNLVPLLSNLFVYKNTFKTRCLRILELLRPRLDDVFVRRLVGLYTDRGCDDLNQARFFIAAQLRGYAIGVDGDSLRMANALIADFEEKLGQASMAISNIKECRAKKTRLTQLLDHPEDVELSDDEESSQNIDESPMMRALSMLTDAEMRAIIAERLPPGGDLEEEFRQIKNQIELCKDPFRMKVTRKLHVNDARLERQERALKGSLMFLENVLEFLGSAIVKNRKLFLNRSVFTHLCQVISGSLFTLVGPGCSGLLISDKDKYNFDPGKILRKTILIAIDFFDEKLVPRCGLDHSILSRAVGVCKRKYLLSEDQAEEAMSLVQQLRSLAAEKGSEPGDEEVPEEFIDPLTFIFMENPVRLLTSNATIDRSTFNQIMLNDRIDPFSRKPLDETLCVPDSELKRRIDEFLSRNK